MSLNNLEKTNYIKNTFHQYFDLTLNKSFETTQTVNLIIPIDEISGTNVETIINSFDDTPIIKEKEVFCTKVIDGDTIWVKDVLLDENGEKKLSNESYKVRLVGVNTPEKNKAGYDEAKNFVIEACLYKNLYLNIDSKKEKDNYDRYLAVIIVNNKNLNEILLKMGYATVMYIPPSEFDPNTWEGDSPQTFILETDGINLLSPYFNPEMTNIVFTPQNNLDIIYRYEIYQGVIYVKLNPFSQNIRMHILPKSYDCSDVVLFFKDNMKEKEVINITEDYHYYEEKDYINSYYHINEVDRDRDNPDISNEEYNINDWENTFCDFSFDVSKSTKNMNNVQICAGYRYNKTTPYYAIHYTGIRDNTNIAIEDRCTLIDANYDTIEEKTNNITQYHYDSNNILYIPKASRDIKASYGDIDHISKDSNGKLHRKTLKYINDILYSEEKRKYAIGNWVDISEED